MSKYLRIEYEIPPLRAIYEGYYEDDGQTDDELREAFAQESPSHRIRKIERLDDKPPPTETSDDED